VTAHKATPAPEPGPVAPASWRALPPFASKLDGSDQVLLIAGTGGSKSTLAATLTLPVASLVAIDEKARLTLPRATVHELPPYEHDRDDPGGGSAFRAALTDALRWRPPEEGNRIILRPYVLNIEDYEAHDAIYRAVYLRGHTLLWIDEITATGATAQRSQPWLRAISARGRTRGLGLITLTQAPFGLTPAILRRNASYVIFGPIDPDDTGDIRRAGIEAATELPLRSGLFIVYPKGDRAAYRLHLPIPSELRTWESP
jgi:hypothetical protein